VSKEMKVREILIYPKLFQAFDDSMNLPLMHKMCTLDLDSYLAFEEFEVCDN